MGGGLTAFGPDWNDTLASTASPPGCRVRCTFEPVKSVEPCEKGERGSPVPPLEYNGLGDREQLPSGRVNDLLGGVLTDADHTRAACFVAVRLNDEQVGSVSGPCQRAACATCYEVTGLDVPDPCAVRAPDERARSGLSFFEESYAAEATSTFSMPMLAAISAASTLRRSPVPTDPKM